MLQKIRRGFGYIVNTVNYAALISCFLMAFIVAIDVVIRKMRLGSITGSNELTTYLMVFVCLLGIPTLQLKQGHIWVDLFVRLFHYRFRCIWRFIITAIETVLIALLAVGGYNKIVMFMDRATTTDVLHMPKSLFAVAGLVAFAELFVLSLIDALQFGLDAIKGERQPESVEGWSEEQAKGI